MYVRAATARPPGAVRSPPTAVPAMNELVANYTSVLRRLTDSNGRARRREYWLFFLGNMILAIVLGVVIGVLSMVLGATLGSLLGRLLSLAIGLAGLAVGVRRLHDTGRSGWWILVGFVPLVGWLALLYFYVQDSQPGTNEYGPNPKESAFAYAV